jgi:aminomethyltransferase
MACLELKGDGALHLLNAIQPRDLAHLPIGCIRYTLLLREDGSVLNDATVWRTSEDSYLLFVGRRADLEFVAERAVAHEVQLDDRSGELAVLALQGPRSRDILQRCVSMPRHLPYFRFAEAAFGHRRCLLANIGYTGESGYEIVLGSDAACTLWISLCEAGAAEGLRECGFTAANTLRIEAGHILFANELAAKVTAYELGMARLLDYYREPSPALRVLRSQRWREPERRLVGLMLENHGAPEAHMRRSEANAAAITSACWSPLLERRIALGYVASAARYPGTRLLTDAYTRATVARLPFYDPGKRLPRAG